MRRGVHWFLIYSVVQVGLLGQSTSKAQVAAKARAARQAALLPEGSGKAVIMAKCQYCHTNERVVGARMTREGWEESVQRMMDLGAPVTASEETILVEYLFEHFAPKSQK